MYLKTDLLLLVLFGAFGALSNAYPFMRFPSDKDDVSRDQAAKAYFTEEMYKVLDKFGVDIQDVADKAASISVDEHFPIERPTEVMNEMASHQLPILPPESKPEFLLDSLTDLMKEMNSYKQLYPESERILQVAGSELHKGVPTPRMGNCVQSLGNEEAEEMTAKIWNAWNTATIPYEFDSGEFRASDAESQTVADVVINELNMISSQTCLRFVRRTSESEYLHFRYVRGTGSDRCRVSHIGRIPNTATTVQFYNWCGKIRGYVQHELLHALGMIHEFVRPDRQNYMNPRPDWADPEKQFNVDTFGTVYDYSSVMNYWNEDSPQNNQNNDTEYNHQGRPRLTYDWRNPQWQAYYWSKVDIYKLKRLFNCTHSGKQGTLTVKIDARATLNADYYSDVASARATVKVTAKRDDQTELVRSTETKPTSNPVWDKELSFGSGSWQSISIQIRVEPNQAGKDNKETPRQLFYVYFGEHDLDHCDNSDCNGIKLKFEYELKHSRDLCNPNPCKNGGTCRFGDITDYTCYCPAGRYGKDCDMLQGNLSLSVLTGYNLPNRRGSGDVIDPQVNVTVYNDATNSFAPQFTSKVTEYKLNTANPTWFERFEFDKWVWSKIVIEVIDYDDGPEENHKKVATYSHTLTKFSRPESATEIRVPVESGFVNVGYRFTSN